MKTFRRKKSQGPAVASPSATRLWWQLWRQISTPDRTRLKAAGLVMVGGSVLAALLPLLIGSLINSAVANGVSLAHMAWPLVLIGSLVIAIQGLEVVRRQIVESVATGFERDSRQRTYGHLLRLDLDRLQGDEVGRMYGRANRSIEGAVKLVKLGALDFLPAVTLALSALAVAITRNPLVALAMMPVI